MTQIRPSADELRAQRRAARAAGNRADILDSAERTFGEHGLEGSLREIAKNSGFSTAAIYNYFEGKQQLFVETLSRRGVELLEVIDRTGFVAGDPMSRLHAIVDAAIDFFEAYPYFLRMLSQVREADAIIPSIVTQYASDRVEGFAQWVARMIAIIEEGQAVGVIRDGAPSALLHFYMILVYEYVFLTGSGNAANALTRDQFHQLVDGALRQGAI
jgi:AcrR family transcriptional regulator